MIIQLWSDATDADLGKIEVVDAAVGMLKSNFLEPAGKFYKNIQKLMRESKRVEFANYLADFVNPELNKLLSTKSKKYVRSLEIEVDDNVYI